MEAKLHRAFTVLILILFISLALTVSSLASSAREDIATATLPSHPDSQQRALASSRTTDALADGACPPLPLEGRIVNVTTEAELRDAVNDASSGDTILLADRVYDLDGFFLQVRVPGVTLRSASGNREAVVLDGNYSTDEIIQVVASDVTIADLTLREAYHHPIHVMSTYSGSITGTLIYNVHIIDPGRQAIKINPHAAKVYFPDDGEVACSHLELTDAGRSQVWDINDSCYTGGVDARQAQGWVIRDNLIEGFWCPGDGSSCDGRDLSEHAIHLWRGCRDTIVERNVLRDNARGVGFGLEADGTARIYPDDPCPGAPPGDVEHYDGVIRNNFVFAGRSELFASDCGFDCGICLWQACGARALHNTVASTQAPFSSIEWYLDNTDVDLINNLVTHNLRDRGGTDYQEGNLDDQPLSLFVDGAGGDLHLATTAAAAIDQVTAPADVSDDIDGDPRPVGAGSDVGADERRAPPPAVGDLRVARVITGAALITATLSWSAPAGAVTTTVRYAGTSIAEDDWISAYLLTDTLPGSSEVYTAMVPYGGGTVYFAIKSRNGVGESALSNNAFWPHLDVYLPLVLRAH